MSGEFRWVDSSYLHSVLENIEDDGDHPVSKSLMQFYRAVAPVERACAWVEAADSSPARAAIGLLEAWPEIERAFQGLRLLREEYKGIADAALSATERE